MHFPSVTSIVCTRTQGNERWVQHQITVVDSEGNILVWQVQEKEHIPITNI